MRKYVDLLQLIHEIEKRGADNGLVVALKYPIKFQTVEETEKDSGWYISCLIIFQMTSK